MVSKNGYPASAGSRLLREWIATTIMVILGGGQVLLSMFTNVDLVQMNAHFLERMQRHSADNLLVGLPLVLAGVAIDLYHHRKQHQLEISQHRLHVLRATMRTVQDIVNNFLNNMQLFRLEAEGALPEPVLQELDRAIENAAKEIRALGNLDVVEEKDMVTGSGIHYSLES